ncbi:MAG: AMP-binding protein [Phycisphaerae bacterium]|nr:AMP-binding protein [Phycisphaerae bacterium]
MSKEESRPSVNVAAWLPLRAAEQPDKPAIIWRSGRDRAGRAIYSQFTFRQMNQESDACAFGMKNAGIHRGTRTILMVRPSPEFFVLTFALYKIGAVPVLIDPGMGRHNMVECLRAVDAEAFIGIPLAQILRIMNRRAFSRVRVAITVGRRWFWRGPRLSDIRADGAEIMASPEAQTESARERSAAAESNAHQVRLSSPGARSFPMADTAPDDPAAIIFTTGSTGPPKGVLYRHGMFDAQVRILRERFDIRPDEIDLPTFPLFALFDPALGMSAVIPEMDFTRPALVDPIRIIEAVRDNGVTHMFGSPALLDRVGRYGEAHGVSLPTIRRVISAGAPVPPETIRRFMTMLRTGGDVVAPATSSVSGRETDDQAGLKIPGSHPQPDRAGDGETPATVGPTQIFTPYGATEALPVAVIGSDEILGETAASAARGLGTCVGRPVRQVEVRIIRITDDPIDAWSDDLVLPTGEVGEIAVKGPVVTREYITSESANRLAKIRENPPPLHHEQRVSDAPTQSHADPTAQARSVEPGNASDVWHRMGDLGRIDSQGRLWFYGRKSHRVTTVRGTLFTEPVEAIFNQHPKVRRSALVGIGDRGCQTPIVCIEIDHRALEAADHSNPNKLGEELFQLGSQYPFTRDIDTFLIHPEFPVDIRHNSKIFREKLAVWAADQIRRRR